MIIKGRIWVIRDAEGNIIHHIDTDKIYHNSYLAITRREEMGKFAFSNLPLWKDFPIKAKPGDIIVAGKNFGSGSSRQQAVDCFIALGISCIVAQSYGVIYRRNAINAGLPILVCPDATDNDFAVDGDVFEVNLLTGEVKNLTRKLIKKGNPAKIIEMDILRAGGLIKYAKKLL